MQARNREERTINQWYKQFFFPSGEASPGKPLEVAVSSLPFTEGCSAGSTAALDEPETFKLSSSFIFSHKVEENPKDSIWVKTFIFMFQTLLLFTAHLTSMATCQSNKYHSTESPKQPSDPFLTVV